MPSRITPSDAIEAEAYDPLYDAFVADDLMPTDQEIADAFEDEEEVAVVCCRLCQDHGCWNCR